MRMCSTLDVADSVKSKIPTLPGDKSPTRTPREIARILGAFYRATPRNPRSPRIWGIVTWKNSNLEEFRKCEFSFYVIDYFNVYAQHCRARSAKVALELLRDVPNIQAQLPENLDDAVKTYAAAPTVFAPEPKKIEGETNLNYLMATLLFRLAATLKSPPQYTTTELSARQTAPAVTFQHVHQRIMPTGFELSTIILPSLGPQMDLGEHDLEQYIYIIAYTISCVEFRTL